jgi:hypothetical protein
MFPAESSQNSLRIVTDYRQAKAFAAKFIDSSLQLDELRFAIGSPVRRANEHQHRTLRSHDGLESLDFAVLVFEPETWRALSHLRSEL